MTSPTLKPAEKAAPKARVREDEGVMSFDETSTDPDSDSCSDTEKNIQKLDQVFKKKLKVADKLPLADVALLHKLESAKKAEAEKKEPHLADGRTFQDLYKVKSGMSKLDDDELARLIFDGIETGKYEAHYVPLLFVMLMGEKARDIMDRNMIDGLSTLQLTRLYNVRNVLAASKADQKKWGPYMNELHVPIAPLHLKTVKSDAYNATLLRECIAYAKNPQGAGLRAVKLPFAFEPHEDPQGAGATLRVAQVEGGELLADAEPIAQALQGLTTQFSGAVAQLSKEVVAVQAMVEKANEANQGTFRQIAEAMHSLSAKVNEQEAALSSMARGRKEQGDTQRMFEMILANTRSGNGYRRGFSAPTARRVRGGEAGSEEDEGEESDVPEVIETKKQARPGTANVGPATGTTKAAATNQAKPKNC